MQWCDGKNAWTWGCAQRTEENHCGEPMQIYLDVSEPGTHTVQFSMREDGFAFDQFVLTRDANDRPSGVESGESILAFPGMSSVKNSEGVAETPGSKASDASGSTVMAFPKEQWQKGSPRSQGVDAAKMYSALEYINGHCQGDKLTEVLIVRNGVVIHESRNTSKAHNIWSCSKSFTSTALGLLIADGKCSLDTKACDIIDDYKLLYPDATPKTYYASGLNHNLLFVVPEWNMVIVRMGVDGNPPMGKPQAWNHFFRLLGRGVDQVINR